MSKAFTYIPSAYKAGTAYVPIPNTAAGDYDFARDSVATRVNENGVIEEMAKDVPRIDYSDGGCPVLLLDGESTNHVQYSYDFTNPYWVKRGGSSAIQNLISPRGINEACSITFAMSSSDDIYRTNILSSGSNNIALSMWIKNTTNSLKKIKINNAQSPSSGDWRVDLSMISNEWTRIDKNHESVTVVIPIADTSGFGIQFQSLIASEFVTIGVWGVQAEVSENTSSYISTNGSTATRNADVCGNSQQVYNPNSLVWKLNMAALSDTQSNNDDVITINNTTANSIRLGYTNENEARFSIASNSSYIGQYYLNVNSSSSYNDFSIKSTSDNFFIKVNGILVNVNTLTKPLSLERKDYHDGNNSFPFKGKIQSDIVSEDLTTFDSTVTSIAEILTNSKLTIR